MPEVVSNLDQEKPSADTKEVPPKPAPECTGEQSKTVSTPETESVPANYEKSQEESAKQESQQVRETPDEASGEKVPAEAPKPGEGENKNKEEAAQADTNNSKETGSDVKPDEQTSPAEPQGANQVQSTSEKNQAVDEIKDSGANPPQQASDTPMPPVEESKGKGQDDEVSLFVALPIDQSVNSERAFCYYKRYLHKPEFTVLLIHIHTVPYLSVTEENGEIKIKGDWKEKIQANVDDVKKLVEKYSKWCKDANMKFHVVSEPKKHSIGADLNKVVQDYRAMWIVMARRGLNLFRRTLMGSVSDYLLCHCKVTLTLIPSEFQDRECSQDKQQPCSLRKENTKVAGVDAAKTTGVSGATGTGAAS